MGEMLERGEQEGVVVELSERGEVVTEVDATPHIQLCLFHHSATFALPSVNSIITPSCSPLSKISPKPFPTYFPRCVLSTPPHHGSPPDPLNI